jgi:hypothetical protein
MFFLFEFRVSILKRRNTISIVVIKLILYSERYKRPRVSISIIPRRIQFNKTIYLSLLEIAIHFLPYLGRDGSADDYERKLEERKERKGKTNTSTLLLQCRYVGKKRREE